MRSNQTQDAVGSLGGTPLPRKVPHDHESPAHASPVLTEQRGTARWVWLNRPQQRNALTPELIARLNQAIGSAMADPETRVVVIAGRGPSFCAGADLVYLSEIAGAGDDPMRFLADVSACFSAIEQAPKPVVAAVHGHAVAGGLELALACDVIVAAAGTLVGDGHVRNGLLPGGGASVRLPRKVGEPLARWMMLTGELVPVERFTHIGFVHTVVPKPDLGGTVTQISEQLEVASAEAHIAVKQLLHRWHETPADEGLSRELDVLAEHWNGTDIAGSLARFLNRKASE